MVGVIVCWVVIGGEVSEVVERSDRRRQDKPAGGDDDRLVNETTTREASITQRLWCRGRKGTTNQKFCKGQSGTEVRAGVTGVWE